jgi:chemotaxis methyl-accepting protein methylase
MAQLDLSSYRCETLARRLPACLRALRARSLDHADSILKSDPRLIPAAMEQLLIGVTSFFRDEAVFDAIRTIVIPALAERRKPLRIWSAGCSSGAELYSVAMLLDEHGLIGESLLLGTDCRPEAIRAARRATYDSTCLRQVPPHLAGRLLVRCGDQLRAHCDLIKRTRWRCADLLNSLEPGGWDMILCRNLAMYLAPDSAARLWEALDSLLLPAGWLIVGKAERPAPARRLRAAASCVFQRQN